MLHFDCAFSQGAPGPAGYPGYGSSVSVFTSQEVTAIRQFLASQGTSFTVLEVAQLRQLLTSHSGNDQHPDPGKFQGPLISARPIRLAFELNECFTYKVMA